LPEKIFFTSVIRYDMDYSFLFTLFEGLDRQGPGSDTCTRRMSDILSPPEDAQILDIGCGAGSQTLTLARRCMKCCITAVDIHQPFLDALHHKGRCKGDG
jgi:trans-aconitate methyltransferase